MRFDPAKVAEYVRGAATEDLLDRVTVLRDEMEPAAVDLMTLQLTRRGITADAVAAYGRARREAVLVLPNGVVRRCSVCGRPAVARGWGWHRLFGLVPIFPREFTYCERHARPKPVT